MKLVGIKVLKPGEKLAYPIYSASGKVILNAGCVISETYIEKLKKMGVYTIYIDDEKFSDIELPEAVNNKTRSQVHQAFKQAHNAFHKGELFDELILVDSVKMIVEDVISSGLNTINTLPSIAMDDYLVGHCVNVCILSILLGNNMDYNFNQLVELGVGALIHDIARKDINDKNSEHVQKGFEVMKKHRNISLHSSKIIYEHHEAYDGTGYPRGVTGNNISQFSKIVSVIDYYDNLILVKNEKVSMLPHQAYEALLAEADKRFDPDILEVFRKSIAFYPNGSTVKLSNDVKGIVIKQNKGTPHRPVIRIIEEEQIKEDIDLIKHLTIFIEAIID